ncbi:SMI1/KNR4 family protein [Streptomyces sp. NBC_00237]|uniref:SMI1/KNR4 family protein n=1 Tax=Streptomyces sp. NBC_00237 TaxID=2975687 RepID=UPI002251843F|nr:SMI1/KNR4 family protein [Streptomyces sp. NBC_00237]MCX5206746.1 SMI1/KNR4 family protein [Streptomyces sp. NBC_00237]
MSDHIQSVTAAWDRIELWLHEYAPESAVLLRPPASEEHLTAIENTLGASLPPTLRTWYQLHDGAWGSHPGDADSVDNWDVAGWLPTSKTWLRLDEIQRFYNLHVQDWEREPGMIPIACNPADGWYGLYVDARQGEPTYGNLGTWAVDQANEPMPVHSVGWPLEEWLEELASALEQRRCLRQPDGSEDLGNQPVIYQGGLKWIDSRDGFKDGMRYLGDL